MCKILSCPCQHEFCAGYENFEVLPRIFAEVCKLCILNYHLRHMWVMSFTHNFLYSSWLLIHPYVKEEDSIMTIKQMKNIFINQRKSKLLAWEFNPKSIRACLGQCKNQSYKIVKVEHELQLIKGISVKSSILWSPHILYSQNTIFLFHSFKLHFYWRRLVTMTF